MSLELAIRITEILLAIVFIQQSLEHLSAPRGDKILFLSRIILSLLLVLGFYTQWVCLALVINGLFMLNRFQGPYNGGSDRMGILILCCLCLANFAPSTQWKEYFIGYLALQLVLSYFISGWVKITNPKWREGIALQDVFLFSAYPAGENVRKWAGMPRLLFAMSWAVMLFELIFPLALITQQTLIAGLVVAATFHFANACLFGLNRFFWVWIAAYPSIIWLQQRIFL